MTAQTHYETSQSQNRAELSHKELKHLYESTQREIIAIRADQITHDIAVLENRLIIQGAEGRQHVTRSNMRDASAKASSDLGIRANVVMDESWAGEEGRQKLQQIWDRVLGTIGVDDEEDNKLLSMLVADYSYLRNVYLECKAVIEEDKLLPPGMFNFTSSDEESEEESDSRRRKPRLILTEEQILKLSNAWEQSQYSTQDQDSKYATLESEWSEILGISLHHMSYRDVMGLALAELRNYAAALVKPTLLTNYRDFLLTAITEVPTAKVDLLNAPKIVSDLKAQLQFCLSEESEMNSPTETEFGEAVILRLERFLRSYTDFVYSLNYSKDGQFIGYKRPKDENSRRPKYLIPSDKITNSSDLEQYLLVNYFLEDIWPLVDSFYARKQLQPGVFEREDSTRLKSLMYGTPYFEDAIDAEEKRVKMQSDLYLHIQELNLLNVPQPIFADTKLGLKDMPENLLRFNTKVSKNVHALVAMLKQGQNIEIMIANDKLPDDRSLGGFDMNLVISTRAGIEDAIWELSRAGEISFEAMQPVFDYINKLQAVLGKTAGNRGENAIDYFIGWYRGIMSSVISKYYYKNAGYEIVKVDHDQAVKNDHNKVDMIVKKDKLYYVQVKSTPQKSMEIVPSHKAGYVNVYIPNAGVAREVKEMTPQAFLNLLSGDRKLKYKHTLEVLDRNAQLDSTQSEEVSWRLIMINPDEVDSILSTQS